MAPDLDGIQFERFREAYDRVVRRTHATAAEMAVALGQSTKTLDNWRARPPRTRDIPFAAVVRMSELSGLPLGWFAGADESDEVPPRSAPTNAEVMAELADLRQLVERRLAVRLGDEAELDQPAPAARRRRGRAADGG
jgi:hypothetical protein